MKAMRSTRDARTLTFVVSGVEFELPKPFLKIHSPRWAERLALEPYLTREELDGDPDSFDAFVQFLKGAEGLEGEVTAENVEQLLHWGSEFGVDYVASQCEDLLLSKPPPGLSADTLLHLAARYDMPLLYTRATELVAQGMCSLHVPEHNDRAPVPAIFNAPAIREDIVRAHIGMGVLRSDGEVRRRNRFADQTTLDEPKQRARLLWKSRSRVVPPPEEPPEPDWRAVQTVWPHHSMRGSDWTCVQMETQPTFATASF